MAASSSETAFVTIEKSFTYRGAREIWANTYHVDQVPASTSVWDALASAINALERQCLPGDVQTERLLGHEPGTPPILVYEYDVPPAGEGGMAGTYVPSAGDHRAPGDSAIWLRWGTTQKNSLGKPIYLRNYYHAVYYDSSPDLISATQKPHFDALGQQLTIGVAAGGTTFHRAGPRGAVAQNHVTGDFITTRTLRHRGRRHRWTKAVVKAIAEGKYPGYLLPRLNLNAVP